MTKKTLKFKILLLSYLLIKNNSIYKSVSDKLIKSDKQNKKRTYELKIVHRQTLIFTNLSIFKNLKVNFSDIPPQI